MHLGKVMTVFGTRPEAIKMAPVIQRLSQEKEIANVVLVTAQHREMLDQVLELFKIKPDYDLDLMRAGQDLYGITSGVLLGIKDILRREKPDLVLVHGDTTTTFAAALAAFYEKIPVGHVEAGLRTREKYSPFPEEMNRTLTGSLAELHFAPTETARQNLLAESRPDFKIWVTGNTVIDALLSIVRDDYTFAPPLNEIDFSKRILLVTTHRRENWGAKMKDIYLALLDLLEAFADIEIVFPVHKNPIVRDLAVELLGNHPRVHLLEPLDYENFAHVMNAAYIILTDSGGMQEEAPSLGKPVLVMRDSTERPEAVEAGTVKLTGTSREIIFKETSILLQDENEYNQMARALNPYGDGQAAMRIISIIKDFLYARKGSGVF